jgi:hypothetical protein
MIHSDSHGWISFDDALPPASALEVLVAFKHKSDTYTGVGRIEVFDQADEGFPNPGTLTSSCT